MIGGFIVTIGLYLSEYPYSLCKDYFESGKLLFMTILVMTALSFLSGLSSIMGYGRRRDHVVACASNPDDEYSIICGNGRGKSYCDYLLGVYGCFYHFFLIALVLFALFSCFIIFKSAPTWQRWIVIIGGILSIIIPLLVNCHNYYRYTRVCRVANSYEQRVFNTSKNANSKVSKSISINVNC